MLPTQQISRWFSIIVTLLTIVSCSLTSEQKIIGEWKGVDHTGEISSFTFYDDKKVKMTKGNESSPDDAITWKIDDSKEPIHLDLLAKQNGETRTLPLILRFINDTQIELRMGENILIRPEKFDSSDVINQIILIKQ